MAVKQMLLLLVFRMGEAKKPICFIFICFSKNETSIFQRYNTYTNTCMYNCMSIKYN